MRKDPFRLSKSLLLFSLIALVFLSGCGGDDQVANVVPQAEHEIIFGLWLFDPSEISIVAGVYRLDSSGARADSCVIQVNGEELPILAWSNADSSYYQLALPGFSADASYSFVATLNGKSANAVLTAPSSLATLQIVDPPEEFQFSPGDAIPVTWDYVGPSYLETSVGLVAGCPSHHFEHRDLLDGDARSHTFPSTVTQQLELHGSCYDHVYVEVIAENTGVVEGDLASASSKWYVVLASETTQLEMLDPVMPDSISIKSVTPDSRLVDGVETDFTVAVEYHLASADSGEVAIGFNNVFENRYSMVSSAKALVVKGSGEHTFNVSVVTKDWGSAADFAAYVNLSEHPHESSWTPLDVDTRVLTFE